MTFMSTFPSHLPSQHQAQTFPEIQAQQQPKPRRRTTQASTATQSSTSTKSVRFFHRSSRTTTRLSSVDSSASTSSESDSIRDNREETRVRRWGRKAINGLGRAFSAYPQGRSVGIVWYTGF
ncbi:hypothetical protein AYO22_03641 [Fonsecaea multimorphosa]|nr:hypothetical protein AYO22_03641 [Fonsecaea multimorphosa]